MQTESSSSTFNDSLVWDLCTGVFWFACAAALVAVPILDFSGPYGFRLDVYPWGFIAIACAVRIGATGRIPWLAAIPPVLLLTGHWLENTIAARFFSLIADEGGALTAFGLLLRNGWWLSQLVVIVVAGLYGRKAKSR